MKKIANKIVLSGFTLVFSFTQVLFAHLPEQSFWDQRHTALQSNRSDSDSSKNISPLLAQVPPLVHVTAGAGSMKTPVIAAPETKTSAGLMSLPKIPASASLLQIIPAITPWASVRSIRLGPEPDKAPVVINIQDVHGAEEAQRNIFSLILDILKVEPQALIGLEGSAGRIPLDRFRTAKGPVNREMGSFFFNSGLITGAEYAGFAAPAIPDMVGIDDSALYLKNVTALKGSLQAQRGFLEILATEKTRLDLKKQRLYSPSMMELDQKREGYEKGSVGLGDYIVALLDVQKAGSRRPEMPLLRAPDSGLGSRSKAYRDDVLVKPGPAMSKFLTALRLEKAINFAEAERERNAVLAALTDGLKKSDLNTLIQHTIDLGTGKISTPEFHAQLKILVLKSGIDLKKTPQFDLYLNYVAAADSISPEGLLLELAALENAVWLGLCQTPAQKEVYAASRELVLSEKLANLSLTPPEWQDYQDLKKQPSRLTQQPRSSRERHPEMSLLGISRGGPEQKHLRATILPSRSEALVLNGPAVIPPASFESFYDLAEKRNGALAANFLNNLSKSKSKLALIVSGGFHSQGLQDLLAKSQVTVVTVTPKLSKIDKNAASDYLALFTRDKTPLEKLFESPKIGLIKTLSTNPIGDSPAARAVDGLSDSLPSLIEEAMEKGTAVAPGERFTLSAASKGRKLPVLDSSIIFSGETDSGIRIAAAHSGRPIWDAVTEVIFFLPAYLAILPVIWLLWSAGFIGWCFVIFTAVGALDSFVLQPRLAKLFVKIHPYEAYLAVKQKIQDVKGPEVAEQLTFPVYQEFLTEQFRKAYTKTLWVFLTGMAVSLILYPLNWGFLPEFPVLMTIAFGTAWLTNIRDHIRTNISFFKRGPTKEAPMALSHSSEPEVATQPVPEEMTAAPLPHAPTASLDDVITEEIFTRGSTRTRRSAARILEANGIRTIRDLYNLEYRENLWALKELGKWTKRAGIIQDTLKAYKGALPKRPAPPKPPRKKPTPQLIERTGPNAEMSWARYVYWELTDVNLDLIRATSRLARAGSDEERQAARASLSDIQARLTSLSENILKPVVAELEARLARSKGDARGHDLNRIEILRFVNEANALLFPERGERGVNAGTKLVAAAGRANQIYTELFQEKINRAKKRKDILPKFHFVPARAAIPARGNRPAQPARESYWSLLKGHFRLYEVADYETVPQRFFKPVKFKSLWEAFRSVDHQIDTELTYKVEAEKALRELWDLESALQSARGSRRDRPRIQNIPPDARERMIAVLNQVALELKAVFIVEKDLAQTAVEMAIELMSQEEADFDSALSVISQTIGLLETRLADVDSMIDHLKSHRRGEMREKLDDRNKKLTDRIQGMTAAANDAELQPANFRAQARFLYTSYLDTPEPDLERLPPLVLEATWAFNEYHAARNSGTASPGQLKSLRQRLDRTLALIDNKLRLATRTDEFMRVYRDWFEVYRLQGHAEEESMDMGFHQAFEWFLQKYEIDRNLTDGRYTPENNWWWMRLYQTAYHSPRVKVRGIREKIPNPLFNAFSLLADLLDIDNLSDILAERVLSDESGDIPDHRVYPFTRIVKPTDLEAQEDRLGERVATDENGDAVVGRFLDLRGMYNRTFEFLKKMSSSRRSLFEMNRQEKWDLMEAVAADCSHPRLTLSAQSLMDSMDLRKQNRPAGLAVPPSDTTSQPGLGAQGSSIRTEQRRFWLLPVIPFVLALLFHSAWPLTILGLVILSLFGLFMGVIFLLDPHTRRNFTKSHHALIRDASLHPEKYGFKENPFKTHAAQKSYERYLMVRYWAFGLITILSTIALFLIAHFFAADALAISTNVPLPAISASLAYLSFLGGQLLGMGAHWINNHTFAFLRWRKKLGADASNESRSHPGLNDNQSRPDFTPHIQLLVDHVRSPNLNATLDDSTQKKVDIIPPEDPDLPGAILFFKPEALRLEDPVPFVEQVLNQLAAQGALISGAALMNSAWLKEHNVIERHYGDINARAMDKSKTPTETIDAIVRDENLGGADFVQAYYDSRSAIIQKINESGIDVLHSDPIEVEKWRVLNSGDEDALSRLLWAENPASPKKKGGTWYKTFAVFGHKFVILSGVIAQAKSHFTQKGAGILAVELRFRDESRFGIKEGRALVGNTDPAKAAPGSLRNLFAGYFQGATVTQNGVHFSAGPIEWAAERHNLMGEWPQHALSRFPAETLAKMASNPTVAGLNDSAPPAIKDQRVFDATEGKTWPEVLALGLAPNDGLGAEGGEPYQDSLQQENQTYRSKYDELTESFGSQGLDWGKIQENSAAQFDTTGRSPQPKMYPPDNQTRVTELEIKLPGALAASLGDALDQIDGILGVCGADIWLLPRQMMHATLTRALTIGPGEDAQVFDVDLQEHLGTIFARHSARGLKLVGPRLIITRDGTIMIGWEVEGVGVQTARRNIGAALRDNRLPMNIVHSSIGRILPPRKALKPGPEKRVNKQLKDYVAQVNRALAAQTISIPITSVRYGRQTSFFSAQEEVLARFQIPEGLTPEKKIPWASQGELDRALEENKLRIEQFAIRQYHLFRYFFEEIAHVPFPVAYDQDLFLSEAVIAFITHGETVASYQTEARSNMAQMMAVEFGLSSYKRLDECLVMLNAAISNPPNPMGLFLDEDGIRKAMEAEAEKRDQTLSKKRFLPWAITLKQTVDEIHLHEQISKEQHAGLPGELSNNLTVPNPSPLQEAQRSELRRKFEKIFKRLTYREREVVKLRFGWSDGYEYFLTEIGHILFHHLKEHSRPKRAGQVLEGAITKFRESESLPLLGKYAEDPTSDENFSGSTGGRRSLPPVGLVYKPGQWQSAEPRIRPVGPVTDEEIWSWLTTTKGVYGSRSDENLAILLLVLRGETNEGIAQQLHRPTSSITQTADQNRRDVRAWLTLGIFESLGTPPAVRNDLIQLLSERIALKLAGLGADARKPWVEQLRFWFLGTAPLFILSFTPFLTAVLFPDNALAMGLTFLWILLHAYLIGKRIMSSAFMKERFLRSHEGRFSKFMKEKKKIERPTAVQTIDVKGRYNEAAERMDLLRRATWDAHWLDYEDYLTVRYQRFSAWTLSVSLGSYAALGLLSAGFMGWAWFGQYSGALALPALIIGNIAGLISHVRNNKYDKWLNALGATGEALVKHKAVTDVTEDAVRHPDQHSENETNLLSKLMKQPALSAEDREIITNFFVESVPVQTRLIQDGFNFAQTRGLVRQRLKIQLSVAEDNASQGFSPAPAMRSAGYLAGLSGLTIHETLVIVGGAAGLLGLGFFSQIRIISRWILGRITVWTLEHRLALRPYYAPSRIFKTQKLDRRMTPALHLDAIIDPRYQGTDADKETEAQLLASIRNWDGHPVVLVLRTPDSPYGEENSEEKTRAVRQSLVVKLKALAKNNHLESQLEAYLDLDDALHPNRLADVRKGVLVVEEPGLLNLSDILSDSLRARGIGGAALATSVTSQSLGLFTALPNEVRESDWVNVFLIDGMKIIPCLTLQIELAKRAKVYSTQA